MSPEKQELAAVLTKSQQSELIILLSNILLELRNSLKEAIEVQNGTSNVANENNNTAPTGPTTEMEKPPLDKIQLEHPSKALESFNHWQESLSGRLMEVIISKDHMLEKEPQIASILSLDDVERHPSIQISPEDISVFIDALLLIILSTQEYDSRSRTLLIKSCERLGVTLVTLSKKEIEVSKALVTSAHILAEEHIQKRIDDGRGSRRWKVGLATVAGAAVIGVTGGLAAPLVAAGLGTLLGGIGLGGTVAAGYLGAMAASAPLIGSLFGAYGGRMTGDMMDKYAKEIDDFAFIPLEVDSGSRLRVTICISGWLRSKEEVTSPWKSVNSDTNAYALQWETKALLDLGSALETMLKGYAVGYIKKEIIKRTVLASLWSALWPIGLLKYARLIDNPFNVAKNRADKAGELLADALIHRAQGKRPVTLIGFSLGSRLIYSCLLSLAERQAYGIVETVILMGSPVPTTLSCWAAIRTVVADRVVNLFSENDWILAFLYRTSAFQFGVAGLQAIKGVNGVENLNVSDIIDGHTDYATSVSVILDRVKDARIVSK